MGKTGQQINLIKCYKVLATVILLNNFSEELREFRKIYNITQKELCEGICTVSYLSLIENNKANIAPELLQLLSNRMELFRANFEPQIDDIPNENIGKLFIKERNRHCISQETLCYGICTVSYLSKIENNRLVPSLKIKKALYKRLEELKNNTQTATSEILRIEKLYDTMIFLFEKKRIETAKKMLHQGLQATKDKYPELYCLFSYQHHLHFDHTNLKSFLETKAIPFFKKQKDNKQLSILYIDLATCYEEELEFELACVYYQKGISCINITRSIHIVSSNKKVRLQFS